MGEQPCLWSTIKLRLVVDLLDLDDLPELLNMRRLQPLQQLTLYFKMSVSWQDCIHFLQIIPPSVRKLSLEGLDFV